MEFAFNSVKAVMTPTGPTLVGVITFSKIIGEGTKIPAAVLLERIGLDFAEFREQLSDRASCNKIKGRVFCAENRLKSQTIADLYR